jgi:hypothetical protein
VRVSPGGPGRGVAGCDAELDEGGGAPFGQVAEFGIVKEMVMAGALVLVCTRVRTAALPRCVRVDRRRSSRKVWSVHQPLRRYSSGVVSPIAACHAVTFRRSEITRVDGIF